MMPRINSIAAKKLQSQLIDMGITDAQVLASLLAVPREHFIEGTLATKAYENTALPIGAGQTISQPYIVAKMTELAMQVTPTRVLEIGTGCGYQTAVLAKLFTEVYTIERLRPLQIKAKAQLRKLDLHNIKYKVSDGWLGWSEQSEFDAIVVTAAASELPQALLRQLADGGRMIIPVGTSDQTLYCIDRKGGNYYQSAIEAVKFVPLIAEHV